MRTDLAGLVGGVSAFIILAACSGTDPAKDTSTPREDDAATTATGDGGTRPGTDASPSDSGKAPNSCANLANQYEALPNDAANVSCANDTDCKLLSGDLCYWVEPFFFLNAQGRQARETLLSAYEANGCRGPDCGSGGGSPPTPACRNAKCVGLFADGGIAP